jgi:hypothetical protein
VNALPRSVPRIIIETSVILTVLGGIAVLLRIAAVARGNVNLAFAIANVSNFADVLISTLLLAAPVLSLVALLVVTTWTFPVVHDWIRRPNLEGIWHAVSAGLLLAGTAVVTVIFQTSATSLAIVWLGYLVLISVWRPWAAWFEKQLAKTAVPRVSRPRRNSNPIGEIGGFTMAAGITLMLALGSGFLAGQMMPNDAAWSSSEVLQFDDHEPFVGRVIATEDRWTFVVIDDPRELRILPSSQLESRTLCDDGNVAELEARLWTANFFGSVSLRPTWCEAELARLSEIFEANQ